MEEVVSNPLHRLNQGGHIAFRKAPVQEPRLDPSAFFDPELHTRPVAGAIQYQLSCPRWDVFHEAWDRSEDAHNLWPVHFGTMFHRFPVRSATAAHELRDLLQLAL